MFRSERDSEASVDEVDKLLLPFVRGRAEDEDADTDGDGEGDAADPGITLVLISFDGGDSPLLQRNFLRCSVT